MVQGQNYINVVLDWSSQRELAYWLSVTPESAPYLAALNEAIQQLSYADEIALALEARPDRKGDFMR